MFEQLNDRQQEQLFKKLLSRPENSFCADCKAKGASWASMGFGVFLCINCSGVHRSFGMQITRVRSTKLDSWTKADAKTMEIVGNKVANLYWEHQIIYHKKNHMYFEDNKVDYIKQKYIMKLFIKKGGSNPVDILVDRGYNVSQDELIKMYEEQSEEMAKKREKTPKKKFGLKKPKPNKVAEDIDLLAFDDEINQTSLKTNLSSKVNDNDLFDLDFKTDSLSIVTDTKVKAKPTKHDDMFFLDLTDETHHLRKSQSDIEDHKPANASSHYIYNINNVNIYNAPPNNIAAPINNQIPSDKYSVFDVYKLYNAPMYRY